MRILSWMKREVTLVLPAIIYFAIAFNLIHFTVGLALEPDDVRYYTYLTTTLGALIVGKFLIIVNQFNFINVFPKKPLIYNIVWQSIIYGILTFLFRLFDIWIHEIFRYKNSAVVCQLIKQQLCNPLFWSTQIWVFLIFLVFVVFSEFCRVLGSDKVKAMLFGR